MPAHLAVDGVGLDTNHRGCRQKRTVQGRLADVEPDNVGEEHEPGPRSVDKRDHAVQGIAAELPVVRVPLFRSATEHKGAAPGSVPPDAEAEKEDGRRVDHLRRVPDFQRQRRGANRHLSVRQLCAETPHPAAGRERVGE